MHQGSWVSVSAPEAPSSEGASTCVALTINSLGSGSGGCSDSGSSGASAAAIRGLWAFSIRVVSATPLPVARIALASDAPVSSITPTKNKNTTRIFTPTLCTSRCEP